MRVCFCSLANTDTCEHCLNNNDRPTLYWPTLELKDFTTVDTQPTGERDEF